MMRDFALCPDEIGRFQLPHSVKIKQKLWFDRSYCIMRYAFVMLIRGRNVVISSHGHVFFEYLISRQSTVVANTQDLVNV